MKRKAHSTEQLIKEIEDLRKQIGKLKEAEIKRKQTEAETRILAKFPTENPNPVLRLAKDCTILYANKASLPLLKVWGCAIGQAVPHDLHQLIGDVRNSGLSKDFESMISDRIFSFLVVPVVDTDCIYLYGKDVTDRKKLEEQLQQSQKMETIGRLAGGVAHDFNNLLTVILGNAEFGLQDSKPSDPIHHDLVRIEKAAIQARDLINQLLSFSRRQVLKPKFFHLNQTIEELIMLLKRIIGEDIQLKTELAARLSLVCADPVQVQQVLMNLCVNARDAMPQGGQLVLGTRNVVACPEFPIGAGQTNDQSYSRNKLRNYVEITITDTGLGMDQATQKRIFEPFFTTKELGKGTGLGLSVVYGIVKQHEGHIEVISEVGKGTTFKVYFPSVTEPDATEQGEKKIASLRAGEETILVVEDEEGVRNVAVRILKGLGYKVLMANDGMEALQEFEAKRAEVDLVIMDVILPKLGGPETYRRMRAIKPTLSVLFVTGHDVKAELEELGETEQEHISVLRKPYTQDTLGNTVREILDLKGDSRK